MIISDTTTTNNKNNNNMFCWGQNTIFVGTHVTTLIMYHSLTVGLGSILHTYSTRCFIYMITYLF